jgi:hypothetical protein
MDKGRAWLRLVPACLCAVIGLALMAGCRPSDTAGGGAQSEITRVTVAQVKDWMAEGKPLGIIDARSASAWNAGTTKAAGAIRVPPRDVAAHLGDVPTDRTLVVYCT